VLLPPSKATHAPLLDIVAATLRCVDDGGDIKEDDAADEEYARRRPEEGRGGTGWQRVRGFFIEMLGSSARDVDAAIECC
jgi:hypothetical protein